MAGKIKTVADAGIYSKSDYDLLIKERRRLNDLIVTLDKLQACGVECATYREMRDNIDKQLAAIQQHFMTPAPTS